jgi:flavin-binding protein dodecin
VKNPGHKKIESTGSSPKSVEDAMPKAIARAAQSIHNTRRLEVLDTRGHIVTGEISDFRVTRECGCAVDKRERPLRMPHR